MFDQQNQISYPTKSALKNYYIESSLPAFVLNKKYNIKPLPKTHQFYKNDQFIWNNPYRSSKKSYKYYHKQQDDYKIIEEKLKRDEDQKKKKTEQDRINQLKMLRMEDRNRLLSRKSERHRLQNSLFREPSHGLANSFSSKKDNKQKTQLQNTYTQTGHQYTEQTGVIVERMAKSVILRQREGRFQQLKDRRAQIQDLIRKSGQSMRTISTRPVTATKKPRTKMFRDKYEKGRKRNIQRGSFVSNPAMDQAKLLKVSQSLKIEVRMVQRLMQDFEKNAGKQFVMSFSQALDVLKRQENVYVDKSLLEPDFNTKSNYVQFLEFCKIYIAVKRLQQEEDNEEIEIINSFVALGGNSDKTGVIQKNVIINIIKNQFQLTFKIDQLLQPYGDHNTLDYDAFSQIFAKVEESQRQMARTSSTSFKNEKQDQNDGGIKVKYHDFQAWLFLNGA